MTSKMRLRCFSKQYLQSWKTCLGTVVTNFPRNRMFVISDQLPYPMKSAHFVRHRWPFRVQGPIHQCLCLANSDVVYHLVQLQLITHVLKPLHFWQPWFVEKPSANMQILQQLTLRWLTGNVQPQRCSSNHVTNFFAGNCFNRRSIRRNAHFHLRTLVLIHKPCFSIWNP